MEKTEITAYMFVRNTRPPDEDFEQPINEMLAELYSLSEKIEFNLDEYGIHYPSILLSQPSYQGMLSRRGLKISIEVPLPVEKLSWVTDEDQQNPEELKSLYCFMISGLFKKRIYDLFIAANLAYPGTLDVLTIGAS